MRGDTNKNVTKDVHKSRFAAVADHLVQTDLIQQNIDAQLAHDREMNDVIAHEKRNTPAQVNQLVMQRQKDLTIMLQDLQKRANNLYNEALLQEGEDIVAAMGL